MNDIQKSFEAFKEAVPFVVSGKQGELMFRTAYFQGIASGLACASDQPLKLSQNLADSQIELKKCIDEVRVFMKVKFK